MERRFLAFFLVIAMLLPLGAVSSSAVDLPEGWWPYWSAYSEAVKSGNLDEIVSKGNAVEQFYSKYPRTYDMAENLYLIYLTRLDKLIFEERGDYTAAIENTKKLREVSEWITAQGVNRSDVVKRCDAHLKLLEVKHGVYAASYTQNNTYGSKIAAASGTYFGTVHEGVYAKDGSASIASLYIGIESETLSKFDHYIDEINDGSRVLLFNFNFDKEGDTARVIPNGTYDDSLKSSFNYISKLECPVLVRIGGEMDVWTKSVTPEEFIKAYDHVAKIARSTAPNAELVWSPNCVSGFYTNTEDYYPDDSNVDFVGLSLYYNYDAADRSLVWLEYSYGERFADPLNVAEKVIEIARAHGKPVIATEGGIMKNGTGGEALAARLAAKEFSALTMMYPEVKAIVYFDKKFGSNDYTLAGSVLDAVNAAIEANPTLIASGDKSAATYIPLEKFNENVEVLELGALGRTYKSMDMTAEYLLDGTRLASNADAANRCTLELKDIPYGKHKLEVKLSDGNGYSLSEVYTLNYSSSGRVLCSKGFAVDYAKSSTQSVLMNDKKITLSTYQLTDATGGSTNYVRLRDIAALMNETGSCFEVGWNAEKGIISVETGKHYTAVGGEGKAPFTEDKTYNLLDKAVSVDSVATKMEGILMTDSKGGGHTYFKLRDLGKVCGFEVDWNANDGIIINA